MSLSSPFSESSLALTCPTWGLHTVIVSLEDPAQKIDQSLWLSPLQSARGWL